MADYYRMLLILSTSLDAVLLNCRHCFDEVPERKFELFPIAVKLRNQLLFRECLILLLGPFSNPSFKRLEDSNLKLVAKAAFEKLTAKFGKTQQYIWERASAPMVIDGIGSKERIKILTDALTEAKGEREELHFPVYYRIISKNGRNGRYIFKWDVNSIMKCDLRLVEFEKSGKEEFEGYFLCDTQLTEKDFPWDCSQTEW
jgi:hypothetical protein